MDSACVVHLFDVDERCAQIELHSPEEVYAEAEMHGSMASQISSIRLLRRKRAFTCAPPVRTASV